MSLLAVPVMLLLLVFGPILLPEQRDPNAGELDLVSVALSLTAILPFIYGLKELVRNGFDWVGVVAVVVGVPAVAGWRLASLPRGPDTDQVQRLLGSCDRDTTVGRRDYAILTMLARLGLCGAEVAAVELGASTGEVARW